MEKQRNKSSTFLLLTAVGCLVLWLLPTWQRVALPEQKQIVTEVRLGFWFSPWLVWRDTRRTDGPDFEQNTEITLFSWSWIFPIGAEVALWTRRRQRQRLGTSSMDWVTLTKQQVEADTLPRVCMVCGQPATCQVNHTFAHTPEWVGWLYLAFILPGLIAEHFLTNEMRVSCPFCSRHRNHWRALYWLTGVGWLVCGLVLAGVGYLVGLAVGSSKVAPTIGLAAGAGIGLAAWLVAVVYVNSTRIHATKVTSAEITFQGIHNDFVRAVRDQQDSAKVQL
jgi:hypothetical protein